MAYVVVVLDIIHSHCSFNAGLLIKIANIAPKAGVIDQALHVALKVTYINWIEPYKCRK